MKIPEILATLLLLVTQFFEDEKMQEDSFFKEFSAKLQEICRLAIEENLETDELIRLLTPLLDLLTKNVSLLLTFRKKFLKVLTESFSSLPLTFSLQKMDIGGCQFILEPKTISLSIKGSIMYEANTPTNCKNFLERLVRFYPNVRTPVIQFWILSMGIFENIFDTFGDFLKNFCLPPKVPEGHPHPFRFIRGYVSYYKFDLFDQIFTILNKSVSELKLTSNDFHQILSLLKEAQNTYDEKTLDYYPRERWTSFVFISALIGFQLRDMLSNPDDKKMVTDVLKINEIGDLQLNVKAELRYDYLPIISLDFFKDRKANTEVDYTYILCAITDFDKDLDRSVKASDALQKFYEQLNC
jgi:hypothetical protein